MFGLVRIRDNTVSRRDIVWLKGWFVPVAVAVVVVSRARRLPRDREREILLLSSLSVGRWPSCSPDFSSSS